MTKRPPLSPLAQRIYTSCEAHARAYPDWGKSNTELTIDKLRAEIAATKPRRERTPSLADEIRQVEKAGHKVKRVITEPGRRTIDVDDAGDDSEARDARVVAFDRIAKLREGHG